MECNLRKVMSEKNVSIEAVAGVLGLHRNSVRNKLTGESTFTIQEGFTLKRNLFPEYDLEYLFSENNQEK